MRQTTKDKIIETVASLIKPTLWLYIILIPIFMEVKPDLAETMVLIPLAIFFAGLIGFLIFFMICRGYLSVKEIVGIWKQ